MNSVDTTSYLEMTTTSLYSPVIRPHERLIDEDEPVSKKTYETTCEPVYHSPNGMIPDKSQSPRITSSTEIILVRRRPSTDLRSSSSSAPVTVSKRNERERNRVKLVNMGFHTLRQHIPNGSKGKMSKVETLRSAVEYIRALQSVLNDDQPLDEVQSLTNFMCLKNLENCISYQ